MKEFVYIEKIDIYLAEMIENVIYIDKSSFKDIIKLLSESYKIKARRSLLRLMEDIYYQKPKVDQEGNIISLPFGGDIWPFKDLELIKNYIKDNSFMILKDDKGTYYKVIKGSGEIRYHKEK